MTVARFFAAAFFVSVLWGQPKTIPCSQCEEWNLPQKPFQVYGNTYYVGTHNLSSILVTSPQGHVLIDAALPESVPQIAAHIRELGFRVEDVKLIVTSHAHFDHSGGAAGMQKLAGAKVAASPWTAEVMKKGAVPRTDPQFAVIRPIARVARVEVLKDGQTLRVGPLELTAHFTPGHTPGGTSWTWRSCEQTRCANLVYADSLTAVSADDFYYTSSRVYPAALADLERSIRTIEALPCDILLTPHPEVSNLWQRLEARNMFDPGAREAFLKATRERLKNRLETEAQTPENVKRKGR
ncbi:MAG: subclass B3 metallo-beta-lactamase [Acidobacteriota bacterium]